MRARRAEQAIIILQVVEESSAALGVPNETPLHLSNTNHLSMGRCASQKDGNYKKLRNRIAAEIREHQLAAVQQSLDVADSEVQAELRTIRGQRDQVKAGNVLCLLGFSS